MPGPNDHHFEMVDGVLRQLPGLGADEPSEQLRAKMDADAVALRVRKTELAELDRAIKGQAADHEQREKAMVDREAELEEKAAALELDKQALERRLKEMETKEREAPEKKSGFFG